MSDKSLARLPHENREFRRLKGILLVNFLQKQVSENRKNFIGGIALGMIQRVSGDFNTSSNDAEIQQRLMLIVTQFQNVETLMIPFVMRR